MYVFFVFPVLPLVVARVEFSLRCFGWCCCVCLLNNFEAFWIMKLQVFCGAILVDILCNLFGPRWWLPLLPLPLLRLHLPRTLLMPTLAFVSLAIVSLRTFACATRGKAGWRRQRWTERIAKVLLRAHGGHGGDCKNIWKQLGRSAIIAAGSIDDNKRHPASNTSGACD